MVLHRGFSTRSSSSGNKPSVASMVLGGGVVAAVVGVLFLASGYSSSSNEALLLSVASSTGATGASTTIETSASPIQPAVSSATTTSRAVAEIPATASTPRASHPTFLQLAEKYGTDKVKGTLNYPKCMANKSHCARPDATNDGCKVTGHFYNRIYEKWLTPYSFDNIEPQSAQFLEIGFYRGAGFEAYMEFLPNMELHSMEISCIPPGPRNEGKWPWGNFGEKNKHYQRLLDSKRLHCGDASDYKFLYDTWTTHMKRPDAPPLKVVVEDASHVAAHMVASVFFWFPRIEPGGILVVEDIESQTVANKFRTDFLPQLMMDLHHCGLPDEKKTNQLCFPTLQPLLRSISCDLHICVLERNEKPAIEYNEKDSTPPNNALNLMACYNRKL